MSTASAPQGIGRGRRLLSAWSRWRWGACVWPLVATCVYIGAAITFMPRSCEGPPALGAALGPKTRAKPEGPPGSARDGSGASAGAPGSTQGSGGRFRRDVFGRHRPAPGLRESPLLPSRPQGVPEPDRDVIALQAEALEGQAFPLRREPAKAAETVSYGLKDYEEMGVEPTDLQFDAVEYTSNETTRGGDEPNPSHGNARNLNASRATQQGGDQRGVQGELAEHGEAAEADLAPGDDGGNTDHDADTGIVERGEPNNPYR